MPVIHLLIASSSGKQEPVEIEFTQGLPVTITVRSERFGILSFTERNLFEALLAYRRVLEKNGYLVLCNGARKDAYPSRMALQAGGRKVYVFRAGKPSLSVDLVETLGAASLEQVSSIAEQRSAYEAWIASLLPNPTPLQEQLPGR
jgi:hypothetical protein